MVSNTTDLKLHGIRGAITCKENTADSIESAVTELVKEFVKLNSIKPEQIVSITFSVTSDLNACFPAAIARKQAGWQNVALLDCQQMNVLGDLHLCIRILALVWLPQKQKPHHPYLRQAKNLRPDRSIMD